MDTPQSNLNNKPVSSADNLLGATHAANAGLPSAPRFVPPPPIPPRPATPPVPPKPFTVSQPKPLSTFMPPPAPRPSVPLPPLPAKASAPEGLPAKAPLGGATAGVPPKPFTVSQPKPFMVSEQKPATFAPPKLESSAAASAEQKTQAPPASSVNIRSMLSDTGSMKESGGMAPRPETIRLESLEENAPIFAPQTANQLPGGVVEGSGGRLWAILAQVAGSIVLVVALGLIGYYVVYPLIFPAQQPLVSNMPTMPSGTSMPAEVPAVVPHMTLFMKSPSAQAQVNLNDFTPLDIIDALQTEAKNVAVAGTLKEIVVQKGGSQVPFGKYFSTLLSNFSAEELASVAEDDFTGFLYYNDKGVWPGYVVKLKSGATAADVNMVVSKIEAGDIPKLFVAYPGVPDSFKTGPFKSYPVRFAKFSQPGASLNYGIVNGYVVISTSFDGFKAAVDLLGL